MPEDFVVNDGGGYLMLNDISAYKMSFSLSNYVWEIVVGWNYFEKDTIGKQFVRSIDSISANIAEGFGRYGKKDKIHFYRYSFGSVKESLDWNEKAKERKLLSTEQYQYILKVLNNLPREINYLIKFTNEKLKT
jgi:four helix bundle protein